MTVVTRFAPSPTGFLHIGNARTSIACGMLALATKGKYILRIDDTDAERSREEYVDGLRRDLAWLGAEWSEEQRQSERFDRYNACVEQLKAEGRMYACYETSEEIDIKRKILLGRGLPPLYDREGLRLSDAQKRAFESEGRKPHWRFKLNSAEAIAWTDAVRGELSFNAADLSDPVVIRENGTPTYLFPSAVDDVDMGVTHVVRGEDHITNTAIQIQIFTALGAVPPTFAHLSLLKTKEGKISKRKGGNAIKDLREEGVESAAVVSYLSRLGTSRPVIPLSGMKEAAEDFSFSHFSRASCIFDHEELERLSAKIVRGYEYGDVRNRGSVKYVDESFWNAVRGNLSRVSDAEEWRSICADAPSPYREEAEFLREAASLLPGGEWNENTWIEWTNVLKERTGRKGKQLFMPLRLALTGKESGPELAALLPVIGKTKAKERLER
ncbi:MAG: glutamate--tRNA ligase [Rickettsiales bacterium]